MSEPIEISVCIATFERASLLRRLLESLTTIEQKTPLPIEIVVVDNSASGSARTVVDEHTTRFRRLRYFIEPEQSISNARNRAVAEAGGSWVAFIDDDEVVDPQWLQAYGDAIRTHDADGYFGPVLPRLDAPAPAWLDPDTFLGLPRPPDQSLVGSEHVRTTNACIRRSLLIEQRFDPAFGITGGGDYELFTRLLDRGAVFRWCDQAVSYEFYGANRLNLRWLLQRAFRGGNTYTRVDRLRHPQAWRQFPQLLKTLAGILVFGPTIPLALLRGRTNAVVRAQRFCVQLGHLWAFCGSHYEEYRRRD